MEHQHQPETQVKEATTDHSKMDHSTMQHGHNPSMGMEGHNHAMMIADFKKTILCGADTYHSHHAVINYDTEVYWCRLGFYRF